MIKNIVRILLSLLLIAGCSNKSWTEIHEEVVEETALPETEGYISGKFVESYETLEYATTIEFYEDGTFSSYLNVCKAMVDIQGTYILADNKIYLVFEESTGYDFIDRNQPYIFNYHEDKLTLNKDSVSYSCAYVDKYIKE